MSIMVFQSLGNCCSELERKGKLRGQQQVARREAKAGAATA